jgi:hypothetical protein
MYAAAAPVRGVVALGPSARRELIDSPRREPLTPGVFGPEVYGITDRAALTQPTMPDLDREEVAIALSSLGPESAMARQDRQRGIQGASHWGLVLNRRALDRHLPDVLGWIAALR